MTVVGETLNELAWRWNDTTRAWHIPNDSPRQALIRLRDIGHKVEIFNDRGLVCFGADGPSITYRVLDVCGVNNMMLLCERADTPRDDHSGRHLT